MSTKHCTRCDTDKPLDAFATHPKTKDGLQAYCRVCQAKLRADWQEKNREKTRQQDRDRRARNRQAKAAGAVVVVDGEQASARIFPDISEADRAAGRVNLRKLAIVSGDGFALDPGSASPPLGEGGETTTKQSEIDPSTTSTSASAPPAEREDQAAFGGELEDIERLTAQPATPTVATNTKTARFADLPHAAIVRSKTNPRRHFDEAFIKDLADNIAANGILQPVLVRPLPGSRLQETLEDLLPGQPRPTHEIVAGEQRWRAAGIAGLRTMPALVRDLTDAQVLELQLVENLKRRDLHPMEEAEGYERLITSAGLSADQVAERIGKSRSYVYNTLSLLQLVPEARTAFYEGLLVRSVAEQIARHDAGLQPAILKDVTAKDHLGESMSVRKAKEHILNTYMLRLELAPFKTDDADLVPVAGPCPTCPKRAGASPQLFGDIAHGDTCTDPPCFAAKKAAHYERIAEAAAARGQTVITGKEAREIMPDRNTLRGYTRVDEPQAIGSEMKSLRGVLGEDLPATTLLEDPSTHEMIEVLPTAEASKLLRKRDQAKAQDKAAGDEPPDPRKLAEAYEKRWRTAAIKALHEISRDAAPMNPQLDQFARSMLDHTCEALSLLVLEQMRASTLTHVCELLQIGTVAQREGLLERVASHKEHAGATMLLMLASLDLQTLDKPAARIEAVAKDLQVNLADLQAQARKEMKAEAAAKAKPAAAAAPAADAPKPGRTPRVKKTLEQFNADLVDALRDAGNANAFKPNERVRIKGVTVRDGATFNTMGMHATVTEPSGERAWVVQPDHLNFPLTLDYTEIEPL